MIVIDLISYMWNFREVICDIHRIHSMLNYKTLLSSFAVKLQILRSYSNYII